MKDEVVHYHGVEVKLHYTLIYYPYFLFTFQALQEFVRLLFAGFE